MKAKRLSQKQIKENKNISGETFYFIYPLMQFTFHLICPLNNWKDEINACALESRNACTYQSQPIEREIYSTVKVTQQDIQITAEHPYSADGFWILLCKTVIIILTNI